MEAALNHLITSGYLTDEVKVSYDETKKTHIARFYIRNPGQVGHNRFGNDFYVVLYGRKAEECATRLAKGKWCTVSGKISTWNKNDNTGNTPVGVTILASDVYFHASLYEEEDFNDEWQDI